MKSIKQTNRLRPALSAWMLTLAMLAGHSAGANAADDIAVLHAPAAVVPYASQEAILGAADTGKRLVAVGEHGVILLSDDGGRSFRQARSVPTQAQLNAVTFVGQQGWAVGQWGVVLHSADNGETWSLQRSDASVDQPLYSTYFLDDQHGFAVGLWSLFLKTDDGGKTWAAVKIPVQQGMKVKTPNFSHIFGDGKGALFISAEHGYVLRSLDGGQTWTYLSTGYEGSFWAGCVDAAGNVVVGGLRGSIYVSADRGETWSKASTPAQNSITAISTSGSRIFAVGLNGTRLVSTDGGKSFESLGHCGETSYTALSMSGDSVVPYSTDGVGSPEQVGSSAK
ncbi:WD40/YVTN/BNR-like repeat-containing protein [Paraburkholderia dinghuensis]|uniref:Glycosyl hydrolase n=1 Tax=Paraburkholderia dinghuensis TaxID=2305225 RepID=A0A3N6NCG6_9BURK|nr:YCF48-related protein [Paraburkholderia dinghuensis]RQH08991.1 glycosyl hydrolase [Paraburkholderia dinghuensis]